MNFTRPEELAVMSISGVRLIQQTLETNKLGSSSITSNPYIS